jgi:hypothetical protein
MPPWNPEQTIGNLIDRQSISFIASVDGDGYPNLKAMLAPRKRIGKTTCGRAQSPMPERNGAGRVVRDIYPGPPPGLRAVRENVNGTRSW